VREEAAAPARGHAGPTRRPPRLGWVRRTALCEGDVPTVLSGSTMTSPRHPYTGATRGQHVANAVRVRARHSGARHSDVGDSNQFRDSVFEFTKLQKVPTNFKISKNKSCRGALDLQLSQRASYVLINRFVGNRVEVAVFSTSRVTVHKGFKFVFG
jgi:hypothetical protein